MKVGFIGLGRMGEAMARRLIDGGHDVGVYNRTTEKLKPLTDHGAKAVATIAVASTFGEAVFTMLADDAAVASVLSGADGILEGLRPGALHISMSTLSVALTERIAGDHGARGQRFLCAPVFGRPDVAAAAKLFIVAAGAVADLETARPVFEAVSQRVFRVGETPSAASLVKLCGNFMILSAIEVMGEAMTLAQRGGIPKKQLLEVLTGTLFDSPVYRIYGAALAEERFKPAGFAAPLGLKDMRLVGQAAEALRVPMPVLNVLRDHLLQTIAAEGEEVDWSAIGRTIAKNGGL